MHWGAKNVGFIYLEPLLRDVVGAELLGLLLQLEYFKSVLFNNSLQFLHPLSRESGHHELHRALPGLRLAQPPSHQYILNQN